MNENDAIQVGSAFLEHRSVSGEVCFRPRDPSAYPALLRAASGDDLLTVRYDYRKPGPRCLWGWRSNLIQVGSPEDGQNLAHEIRNVRARMVIEPSGMVSGVVFEAVA